MVVKLNIFSGFKSMADLQKDCQICDFNSCAVIVAHLEDETAWVGGNMLSRVMTVSREKGGVGHVV